MIHNKRVLAIVPARSGSKGLPGKNIRLLAGKPLLAWPVEAARTSRYVDRVILSTDSEEYAEIGIRHGAEVPFLRPPALAADASPSMDFIVHLIETLSRQGDHYDIIALLEPTSPLTEAADVDTALEALLASNDAAVSAVGIARMETVHPVFTVKRDKNGLISPLAGGDFGVLPLRQDLDPAFHLDGSFYISTVDAILTRRTFCHDKTLGIETEKSKAYEVDDLIDFVCIEAILKHRSNSIQSK